MKRFIIALLSILLYSFSGFAQEGPSEAELAKKSQNPIANMISVPLQLNTTYRIGDNNSTQNILNFQPVVPLSFEKFNVITRLILPIVSNPNTAGKDNDKGLGDLSI